MPDDVPETPRGASRRRKKAALLKVSSKTTACTPEAVSQAAPQQAMRASELLWRVCKELRRLQRCGDWQAAEQLREVVAPLLPEYETLLLIQRPPEEPLS